MPLSPDPPAPGPLPLSESLGAGERVPGWRLEAVLGEGATSTVYAARPASGGALQALKLQRVPGEAVAARLRREGRVQAQLDHPGLLRVHRTLELPTGVALVMDPVRGGTLESRVRAAGGLPLDVARALLLPVLRGLEHAHRLGVVHRDVKPANVLVDADGGRARLADFGIARILGEPPDEGWTHVGAPMGTPGFMAPEQWADASTAGIAADLFSAGALTWFVLVGRSPFSGPDPTSVLRATLEGRHQDLRSLAPACPPALAEVVAACLAPDPAARPSTLAALIQALDDPEATAGAGPDTWLPGAPLSPPPPSSALPSSAPPGPARPRRLPGVLGASLAGILVGLLGWLGLGSLGVVRPRGAPGEPRALADEPALLAAAAPASGSAAVDGPAPNLEAGGLPARDTPAGEAGGSGAVPGCVASEGELIGWWWSGEELRRGLFGGVRIERDTHVRAAPPDGSGQKAAVRCILPAGSRVEVRAAPLEVGGELWVPLYGGDLRRR